MLTAMSNFISSMLALCKRLWTNVILWVAIDMKSQIDIWNKTQLTVNSPVWGSNPTCTVCSKFEGGEISGFLPEKNTYI